MIGLDQLVERALVPRPKAGQETRFVSSVISRLQVHDGPENRKGRPANIADGVPNLFVRLDREEVFERAGRAPVLYFPGRPIPFAAFPTLGNRL